MSIREALVPADFPCVRELFAAHAAAIDVDLEFQGFSAELANLPGHYAAPGGGLWLAFDGDVAVGCIGLRPLAAGRCELKRLYLRPATRGRSLGRGLVEVALARAVAAGYRRVYLDTLPSMATAIALYRSLGFVDVENYNDNPVPGVVFLMLELP